MLHSDSSIKRTKIWKLFDNIEVSRKEIIGFVEKKAGYYDVTCIPEKMY